MPAVVNRCPTKLEPAAVAVVGAIDDSEAVIAIANAAAGIHDLFMTTRSLPIEFDCPEIRAGSTSPDSPLFGGHLNP